MNLLALLSAVVGLCLLLLLVFLGNKIINRWLRYLVVVFGIFLAIGVASYIPTIFGDTDVMTSNKVGEYLLTLALVYLIVKPIFFSKKKDSVIESPPNETPGKMLGPKLPCPYAKKAAYFCIAAPFIGSFVHSATRPISNASSNIVVGTMYLILLIGLALGLYALSQSRKVKGVMVPAIIGIIFHLVIIVIAVKAFIDYRNQYIYYEITGKVVSEESYFMFSQFGRINSSKPKDMLMDELAKGIEKTCPQCEILETESFEKLPLKYDGIFENKPLNFTYISLDKVNQTNAAFRYYFPEPDPQPLCKDIEEFTYNFTQAFKGKAEVSCIEVADSEERRNSIRALSLYEAGINAKNNLEYDKAKALLEEAVSLKPEDWDYNDALAEVLYALGDHHGVIAAYEKCIEIVSKLEGDNRPQIAVYMSSIGASLGSLGEYQKAIAQHEKSLEILTDAYGENHELVANALNNLGMTWVDLENFEKAKECIEDAIRINSEILGPKSTEVAINYSNLGRIYEDLGNYNKALEYKEHALRLGREVFGDEHPKVALRLSNLGWTYYLMGDYSKAQKCFKEAERIYLKYFSDEHPDLQQVRENMEVVRAKL